MKRNRIIVGAIGAIAVGAIFSALPWDLNSVGTYKKRSLSSLEMRSATEAQNWLAARYIDQSTGQPVSSEKLAEIRTQVSKMSKSKAISFTEQGPDNIGGRTRAIQIDIDDVNHVWAGGVSGGLFVSTNRANTWSRVDSYIDAGASPFISSMTQTPDGTLYVATGSGAESFGGNGVWYSTDKGVSWDKIPGTSTCNEVEASTVDNFVWMATSNGLKKWKVGDASLTSVSVASGSCNSLKVSSDGLVLVAAIASNKTYVSVDGGITWTDKSGSGVNSVPVGASRIEYAISKNRGTNGHYSIYASRTNSNLLGMNVSHDDGQTWNLFIGASGTPSNLDIYRNQGTYNSIISVVPTDNKKILVGGIDIWQWKQTVDNPPAGGFEQLTQWFLSPNSSKYAHADNHEMKWDELNRLYIGNDGGIGITNDYGTTWYPANRGYNVTQFYGIAFDKNGSVMGGAQDNGTLYNDHSLSTFKEFREVNGGDGFECEISFYNPRVMFSSVYYNSISRTGDRGQTWSSFVPSFPTGYDAAGTEGNYHPFHTEYVLAEYYDVNSIDSVTFLPTQDYAAGATIKIPSLSTGDSMTYVTSSALYFDDTVNFEPSLTDNNATSVVNSLNNQTVFLENYPWSSLTGSQTNPAIGDTLLVTFQTGTDTVVVGSLGTYTHYFAQNSASGEVISLGKDSIAFNVSWDTLRVQDPFQSWFLMYVNANGGELWGTRNALRLSAIDPVWIVVARNIGSGIYNSIDVEFSKDLNHCYISAGSGIWRIDGLGSIYTSDANFKSKAGYVGTTAPTGTTATKIVTSGAYEGIAVNPSDPDDIIIFSGFGGANRRSLNATASAPSFTNLTNITTPTNIGCYDGIIDRNDSDIIVVGTASGVFVSEDGGITWDNASTGFDGTPVYEVRQSWRTFDEGNGRPGEIYIGTFGRGIWSSAAYLGIGENDGKGGQEFKTKLKTYPNPTVDQTTLTFNLQQSANVHAYVYSLSGNLVKTVVEKNVPAGSQTLTIDCENLPKGTYIIKFAAGSQNETVKFIKM